MSLLRSSAHPFPAISPATFPSPLPQLRFSVLTCLAHLFFFTLYLHTWESTSIWLYIFCVTLVIIDFVSIFSSWYFCHNSSTLSVLFPAHCSLWARHNLQVALSRLSISNPLCPLHLQHCFFSTSFTTISPHAIPGFLVCKCFTPWSNCFCSSETILLSVTLVGEFRPYLCWCFTFQSPQNSHHNLSQPHCPTEQSTTSEKTESRLVSHH